MIISTLTQSVRFNEILVKILRIRINDRGLIFRRRCKMSSFANADRPRLITYLSLNKNCVKRLITGRTVSDLNFINIASVNQYNVDISMTGLVSTSANFTRYRFRQYTEAVSVKQESVITVQ